MAEQNALFNQYENEYAVKSTDVARKIQAISSLNGGNIGLCFVLSVF